MVVKQYVGPRRNPVDVPLLIRHRLEELGFEQRDLAGAAQVTESYISQLLTRRKAPPAPTRTDIYREDGQILEAPAREAGDTGGRPAEGRVEARTGGRGRPLIAGGPRRDPPQMQSRQRNTPPRDF